MRKVIFIFILFYTGVSIQAADKPDDTIVFSPEQLRDDAIFFFQRLFYIHPYPYHFCGLVEFEKRKQEIFSQLDHPMTKVEFMYILTSLNPCLDHHSSFNLNYFKRNHTEKMHTTEDNTLFPEIIYKDKSVYLSFDYEEKEILSINGVEMEQIISSINQHIPVTPSHVHKIVFEDFFSAALYELYAIESPFFVVFKEDKSEVMIKGTPLAEEKETEEMFPILEEEQLPVWYKVYPMSSVALLTVRNFFNDLFEYSYKLSELVDSLNYYGIENLFINVCGNGGGLEANVEYLVSYLEKDSVGITMSRTKRSNSHNYYYPMEKRYLSLEHYENEKFPCKNIIVLQNNASCSCADYFCRLIAENKIGILVGLPTCSFNKDEYTAAFGDYLTNTKILFTIASECWNFSDQFVNETTEPDIYWDTNNKFNFNEEELLNILTTISFSLKNTFIQPKSFNYITSNTCILLFLE